MSRITVILSRNFNLSSTHYFVGQVIDITGQPKAAEIVFDFSNIRFIDGSGLTVFCNTLEWLATQGVKTFFQNHAIQNEAVRYLDDCGFFDVYLGAKISQFSSVRGTTLPVRKVVHIDSHSWLEFAAAPWIAGKLNTIPEKLQTVKVCMKELFNNIHEHSTRETGFVHIQHYPARNRLGITMSDFGAGIPNVIRTKYPNIINDSQAILLATRDGISTKPQPAFCGHGLDLLVQYVVIRNSGTVSIYSGQGGVHCSKQANTVRKTSWLGTAMFPGTLVDITFNTDCTLLDEDEEEDMEW